MLAKSIVDSDGYHLISDISREIIGAVESRSQTIDKAIIKADTFDVLEIFDFVFY